MYVSLVVLVLTKALIAGVCQALNVTVIPGPIVMATEKDNLTVSCLVSQRKRSSSVLILRWFYSPLADLTTPTPSASATPSPPEHQASQFLIVKMGIKKIKMYGNYTRRFPQPKFRLHEEAVGQVYRLRIVNVERMDQGFYTCRVQEIRKHRNTWRASSNGTSTTQLIVHFTPDAGRSEGLLRLLADVYVCAVLICSLGLLSIFLFTLVFTCQYFYRRHTLKANYLLVKCPESSSGETVTSSSSSSGSSPRPQRRHSEKKPERVALKPPKLPEEPPPPHIPAKVPAAAKRPQKPKRLKRSAATSVCETTRRSITVKELSQKEKLSQVKQEESLTYAELELVRPRLELLSSSAIPDPSPSSPDTIYAQILFQEKQL